PEPPPAPAEAVSRAWNEQVLDGIRNDFARPTVHARNLWHTSAAMYDAWAAYQGVSSTYLFGREVAGFSCPRENFLVPNDIAGARAQAMSHAVYRIMRQRFAASPDAPDIRDAIDAQMAAFGYNTGDTSLAYQGGSAAALGNYIADCYLRFGEQDGANELNDYANTTYAPVNPPVAPEEPGNPDIVDLDRWQPITLSEFVDQSGNVIENQPEFLSPEWGQVVPFALTDADRTTYERDGFQYQVYYDPGPPPGHASGDYKWGFSMVAVWSGHLDPADGVMIDISPASIGNNPAYPATFADYDQFYDYLDGGDSSQGHAINPATGQPYVPQVVPRGDYARVLAEFWADGPDSETPPGHWFVILNEIALHPELEMRFAGTGPELDPTEWYVKAYFVLGGAMHDSAVSAWGIKGWYDYLRPLSAIRAMADRGQSSDPAGPSYHEDGIPLVPGYIEVVAAGDPLAGANDEHVGKIKLYAWRGPDYVNNPFIDVAGVDWILAENWWPYQRPTFVTPPFAGYVSGHSTYSRAAAEVLTAFTGSEFFPGGMSGFEITANEFLVFEDGPSVDMTLQWATYRDASDQTSLSRIWGGIHPPADDIPGRIIGEQIGLEAFALALEYFEGTR
ncbi:MAG: vanadium-dependent haloperoxidase, partial [Woeseiaceae bacterium]|nr:vanadium-dependent haloperoxidase [Woeseiaceae bacterium]